MQKFKSLYHTPECEDGYGFRTRHPNSVGARTRSRSRTPVFISFRTCSVYAPQFLKVTRFRPVPPALTFFQTISFRPVPALTFFQTTSTRIASADFLLRTRRSVLESISKSNLRAGIGVYAAATRLLPIIRFS